MSSNVLASSETGASGTLSDMPALIQSWLDVITGVGQDRRVLSSSYHSSYHGNLQVLLKTPEG